MNKTLGALCSAALLGSLAAAAPITSASASGSKHVTVKPAALDRGPDVAVAHLDGRRVVDGDVSLRVRGTQPVLLGKAGDGYVLRVERDSTYQVVRVAPGAPQRELVEGAPEQAVLSEDGATLGVIEQVRRNATVDVYSAIDGEKLASRSGFRGYPDVADIDADHVAVTSFEKGLSDWSWRDDTVEKVTDASVYEVDLGADRLAYFTKDPYQGGCSVVTTFTAPRTTLSRSCRQAVLSFSPDGQRMVTTYKLADGLGPTEVWESTTDGDLLASYRAGYFFGQISWESTTDLLLESYGKEKGATVRCSETSCERASDLMDSPRF